MSLKYRDNQGNESPLAGLNGLSGELVPSVSKYQTGTVTLSEVILPNGYASIDVTLPEPMPDKNYVVVAQVGGGFWHTATVHINFTENLSPSTFRISIGNPGSIDTIPANTLQIKWQAFKLMTDENRALDEQQIAEHETEIAALQVATTPTQLTNEDLNDIRTPGTYFANGVDSVANKPFATSYNWVMHVYKLNAANNAVIQYYISANSLGDNRNAVYTRQISDSSVGDWRKIVIEGDLDNFTLLPAIDTYSSTMDLCSFKAGIESFCARNTATNAPITTAGSWHVTNYIYSKDYVVQIATSLYAPIREFRRTYNNGTWREWEEMVKPSDIFKTKTISASVASNSSSRWIVLKMGTAVTSGEFPLIMSVHGNGYDNTFVIDRFISYSLKDRSNWIDAISVSEATVSPGYIALRVTGTTAFNAQITFVGIGLLNPTITLVGAKTEAEMLELLGQTAVTNTLRDVLTSSDLTSSVTSGNSNPVTSQGVYDALQSKVASLVKTRKITVTKANYANGMSLESYVTTVLDSGYKFLCWISASSSGWVMTYPFYLSAADTVAGRPYTKSPEGVEGALDFYFLEIKS